MSRQFELRSTTHALDHRCYLHRAAHRGVRFRHPEPRDRRRLVPRLVDEHPQDLSDPRDLLAGNVVRLGLDHAAEARLMRRPSTATMEISSCGLSDPCHRPTSFMVLAHSPLAVRAARGRSRPGTGIRQTARRCRPSLRRRHRSRGTTGLPPPGELTVLDRLRHRARSGTPGSRE